MGHHVRFHLFECFLELGDASRPDDVLGGFVYRHFASLGFSPSACDLPPLLKTQTKKATVQVALICKSRCLLAFLKQISGDDQPLDLGSPFVDLGDLGVPHVALSREVLEVAVATEDL